MEDTDPLLPPSATSTYIAGEDNSRLQKVARELGLSQTEARMPQPNIRALPLQLKFWKDDALERAFMHSVGALGNDEHIDDFGNVHMTLTVRKRRRRGLVTSSPGGGTKKPDSGGDLSNLFDAPSSRTGSNIEEGSEEDEDSEEVIDIVEGGNITAAVFGIIKGTIGGAILFLPKGFQMAGYAMAIPIMVLATASYLYSANRLLECWRVEYEKATKIDEIRALLLESPKMYGTTTISEGSKRKHASGNERLLSYPELARRAFGDGAIMAKVGIATLQFGVCLTYLIFVPQNLYEAVLQLFGWEVSKTVFLVGMVLIEIPLAWIRDIRKLAPFNFLATMLVAYGLFSCLVLAFLEMAKDPELTYLDRVVALPPVNHETWIIFIGTAFFSFEGTITLVVPLQGAVAREEDKKIFPSVNQTVTICIVAFYVFFALTCWAAFGSSIRTALTASLPHSPYATSIQLAYSLSLLFTFPLQAFPALEVALHPSARATSKTDPSEYTRLGCQASFIVCLLGVVAYVAIDYLGNVVSLLGSLVGIPIALIFPPIMHNILGRNLSITTKTMNFFVASLGLVVMGVTSYITISQWDKGAE